MEISEEFRVFDQVNGGKLIEIENFTKAGLPPTNRAGKWRIIRFSRKAKQRLRVTMAKNKWSNYIYECSLHLRKGDEPRNARKAIEAVRNWFKRSYPSGSGFYILEFSNEIPHYHFIFDCKVKLNDPQIVMDTMRKLWDRNCGAQISLNRVLAPVRNLEAFCRYISKDEQKEVPTYVKKMPRFWGCFGKIEKTPSTVINCNKVKGKVVRGIVADILSSYGARYGFVESVKQCKKIAVFIRKNEASSFEEQLKDILHDDNEGVIISGQRDTKLATKL